MVSHSCFSDPRGVEKKTSNIKYPLVNVNIKNYGRSPCSMGRSTITMFNSYVKLPEGNPISWDFQDLPSRSPNFVVSFRRLGAWARSVDVFFEPAKFTGPQGPQATKSWNANRHINHVLKFQTASCPNATNIWHKQVLYNGIVLGPASSGAPYTRSP